MNRTSWTRIVLAAVLLASLGACADMGTPTHSAQTQQQEESTFPSGGGPGD
jgi:hypothetical protein